MTGNSGERDENQKWYSSTASFDSLKEWKVAVTRIDVVISNRIELLRGQLPAASEKAVWEKLAPSISISWTEAEAGLKNAEHHLHALETDEMPLGAIGMALEGDRVKTAQDDYNHALAQFVLLDEGMRTKDDVRQTLDNLVDQVKERLHLIEQMEKTSKELRDIHARLDGLLTEAPSADRLPPTAIDMPDIDMVSIAPTLPDETLITQARKLAKSGMGVLEKLPEPAAEAQNAEPSLSSLFGTFAKKSLASLRKSYTHAAAKPVNPKHS